MAAWQNKKGEIVRIPVLIFTVLVGCFVSGNTLAATKKPGSVALIEFKKIKACPATGKFLGACSGYKVGYIVPLCAGGKDVASNMEWQTPFEAKQKEMEQGRLCVGASTPRAKRIAHSRATRRQSDATCFTGPRGGRYRWVNGHKRYGC